MESANILSQRVHEIEISHVQTMPLDLQTRPYSHSGFVVMTEAAFVAPLQNVRLRGPCSGQSSRNRANIRRARDGGWAQARYLSARTVFVCSAQEQGTKEPETLSSDEREELARQARYEAERLELMAERARLDSERAQLIAERKRLELDKYKAMNSRNKPEVEEKTEREEIMSTMLKPVSVDPQISPVNKSRTNQTSPFTPQNITELMGVDFPRIEEKDIEIIKNQVCGMKSFFVTEVDRSPFSERVVFRGNLRLEPDTALERLEELAKEHGLMERVRLFLLLDPKEGDTDPKKPVLVVLPAAAVPNKPSFLNTVLALISAGVTLCTTFAYGVGIFGFTPSFLNEIAKGNLDEFYYTIPISLGMAAIVASHEVGHRVMGKLRNVKLGFPFALPSLQVGSFGTITPLESYPRMRKDMFDVAVAGPIAGCGLSIAALLAGLILTGNGTVADWFPQIPTALFHASVLVGSLADLILPVGMREQATLAVHPLTVIGYTGLLVNALNLLPIGRLDGGRIVQALYGRALANRISAITLILQGISSVFGNSPLLLFWGLICVFLQRESDYPCQNEIVEPDDARSAIGLSILFLMLALLTPFPDQLGDILGRY